MNYKILLAIHVLLIVLLMTDTSWAGLKKNDDKQNADPQACYNPRPDSGDIDIPMPNGLKMVLRAVSVPAKDALSDLPFDMGLHQVSDDRGFYEKQINSHISSPITYVDLPKSWQEKIPADEKDGYYYYFIGKYEVTNAQWNAVMGISDSAERGELPKANISWYDIQLFLKKYNEWLLANHSGTIPFIENSPLYFRLPSEAEWEFAARGGVLPREIQKDFVMEEGKKVVDYAIFGASYDKAMPIGSKSPNKLGMYDTSGNLAEFVQDQFRYTVVEPMPGGGLRHRLHGSQGGFLSKGGSFVSSSEEQVYPGKRVEMEMFDKQGGAWVPHSARSLGMRLVLTSINIPGMRKAGALVKLTNATGGGVSAADASQPAAVAKPAQSGGKNQPVEIDPSGNPVEQLDKIINSTASPIVKSNLEQLRDLLKDYNTALDNERDANLLNSMRSSIYKADSFGNIAFRFYQLNTDMAKILKEKPMPEKYKNEFNAAINDRFKNLEIATNDYRVNGVGEIAKFPKHMVDSKLVQLKKEYAGNGKFYENFRKNIDMFAKHVEFVRKNGVSKLTNEMVWKSSYIPQKIIEMLQNHIKKRSNNKF